MTLYEISKQYRAGAQTLRERIAQLQTLQPPDRDSQNTLDERIRILTVMWREARDLAVLTERYYERGYRRNGRYTL